MSQQEGQRGPLGTTSFISKHQGNWPLIFPPQERGAFSALWLQMPSSMWDTGTCVVSGMGYLAFYG